jgi:ribosomal protein S18 acetylase RimI-like enzyme
MVEYSLRNASPGDFEDIFAVNEAAYKSYVEKIWGWDEAFQRKYLSEHLDYQAIRIVVVGGIFAGFVAVKETGDSLFLSSIALAPEFRSHGIGASILEGVVADARVRGLPVRLAVFKENARAQALYRRLGFEPDGETETHLKFVKRQ